MSQQRTVCSTLMNMCYGSSNEGFMSVSWCERRCSASIVDLSIDNHSDDARLTSRFDRSSHSCVRAVMYSACRASPMLQPNLSLYGYGRGCSVATAAASVFNERTSAEASVGTSSVFLFVGHVPPHSQAFPPLWRQRRNVEYDERPA